MILGANNSGNLTWLVDATFAIHFEMPSHTGGGLMMGQRFIITIIMGQRLNTRSSTEAKLVAVDDCMSLILWACQF